MYARVTAEMHNDFAAECDIDHGKPTDLRPARFRVWLGRNLDVSLVLEPQNVRELINVLNGAMAQHWILLELAHEEALSEMQNAPASSSP